MNRRIPSIKNDIFMSNSAVNILHEQCSISLVVYAPTNVCKLDVKAVFSPLTSVADSCPWRDIRTILGDFSAESGCDRAGNEVSVVLMAWEQMSAARIASFLVTLQGSAD